MPSSISRETKYCDVCEKHISKSNWSKHSKSTKHKYGKKILYPCDHCDYIGTSPQCLWNHKKRRHSLRIKKVWYFGCVTCDKKIRDTDHMKRHIKSVRHLKIISESFPEYIDDEQRMIIHNKITQYVWVKK